MSDGSSDGARRRARVLPVVARRRRRGRRRPVRRAARGRHLLHRDHVPHRRRGRGDRARGARSTGMLVGAGTVLTVEQARAAAGAGAAFAVAPGTDDEVVAACAELGLPFFPGVATPSELGARAAARLHDGQGLPGLHARRACVPPRRVRDVPAGAVHPDRRHRRRPCRRTSPSRLCSPAAAAGSATRRSFASRRFDEIEQPRARRGGGGRMMRAAPEGRVPLRPGVARRGDAAPRPGRGPHRAPRARSRRGRAAASTTSRAACAAASACAPAIVTALADNPVGRLIEDLMLQGGVEPAHLVWAPYDGIGRDVRNGLNFTERGFGVRGARRLLRPRPTRRRRSCSRATSTGTRSSATTARAGSTPAASSPRSPTRPPQLALEAVEAARRHGTVVSYDLNYRPRCGARRRHGARPRGQPRARRARRRAVRQRGGLLGRARLRRRGHGRRPARARGRALRAACSSACSTSSRSSRLVATTLRQARTATVNDWAAVCRTRSGFHVGPRSTASRSSTASAAATRSPPGLIYGLLDGFDVERALEYGVAHGALAMTTPGDTSMATLAEVERSSQAAPRA